MRALVTGAAGFIGANLVRVLLDRGYEVRGLVRADPPGRNLDGLEIDLVSGDVRDPRAVRTALRGCALLFHTAALYSFWVRPRSLVYETNVEGTRNVLQAAWESGTERVVYTSSVAALGRRPDERPADETTSLDPRDIKGDYKKSKVQAQRVALEFAARGLPVVIANPSFPVGSHDARPTPTGQVVLDFLNRRMPGYVETGMNVVAVEDVALGHLLAAEKGRVGECYILGGENLTLRELLGHLSDLTGLPAPRLRLPYYPILGLAYLNAGVCTVTHSVPRMTPDTVRLSRHPMFFDPGKAVRELGLPQTEAREALRRAVDWFNENGYVKRH